MKSNTNMLEVALAYAKNGWAVFPLWDKKPVISKKICPTCLGNCENTVAEGEPENWTCPNCKSRGGAGYKDATTNPELITKWWERWHEAQIGMPTDGYVIVDVDAGEEKVGCESLAALEAEHGELPKTLVQTTPRGGKHYFFMPPEGTTVRNSQGVLGKDIDVRAEGGYIVLAPSKGAKGGSYEWASDPTSTPIAKAPDWIIKLATAKPEPSKVANAAIVEAPNWNAAKSDRIPKSAKVALELIKSNSKAFMEAMFAEMRDTKEGSRNGTLFDLTFRAANLVNVTALPLDVFEGLRLAALDTGLPLDEVDILNALV
ncbi:MAG: bifunctional DNA primase/polymerase, partial [Holophagales bacterium]|nr:bifunctional DNA primase/polymerase [Holophagales bacterium]